MDIKNLKLNADLHYRLKTLAHLKRKPMTALLQELVDCAMKELEPKAAPTPQPKPTQAQNQLNPNIIEHSPGCVSVLCD